MKVAFSRYSRAAVKAKIFSINQVLYLTSLDYLCELKFKGLKLYTKYVNFWCKINS